ncbi:hypothetical protein GOBAR_AA03058 [Gossypium barbadense]|uniref:UDP-glycosyltransferases domain-containing protein n=1 Tax=Gossypium barbadense TaxID=3634 RepID=A0A2P5YPL1_GOSBA|nr:hypothetical protein GOBAR_AA03058 [Gossypium barbadense]
MGSQQIDIVMLPFMAHGHLIPFLSLATQIHHRTGFNIAIANTPLNIQYLRSTFHQHQHPPPWIHLFELPFNSAGHGLPPNSENTENLPLDQIGKLVISSVSLKTPFHNFLLDIIKKQGKPPLCIISDVFFGWVVEVANIMNTLYISFGSQNTVSRSQMMELAIGLEKSWKPLIWVIRPPLGFDLKAEFRSEWLPEGFEARMKESNQGLLVKNWALQLEILSHKSTGAFLSHCGWNSIMESLSQGVKIIGWPMAAEQAFNSKMLVDEMAFESKNNFEQYSRNLWPILHKRLNLFLLSTVTVATLMLMSSISGAAHIRSIPESHDSFAATCALPSKFAGTHLAPMNLPN